MDNGEVIPGLNESWTLGGAKLSEWMAGMATFTICSVFLDNVGKSMPLLMAIWIGTTFGMAALRRAFPDEERGIRNCCMTAMGVPPPKMPTPAALQPYWSGAPMREMDPETEFSRLGLGDLFEPEEDGSADP